MSTSQKATVMPHKNGLTIGLEMLLLLYLFHTD